MGHTKSKIGVVKDLNIAGICALWVEFGIPYTILWMINWKAGANDVGIYKTSTEDHGENRTGERNYRF